MKLFRSLSLSRKSTKRARSSTLPTGKAPGLGERSGSVLIRNKDGSAPRDVPVLRIFLPDETYRALKPSPEMTCGDVIETLWPRLHLGGRRDDYGLYVIYTLADARFVRDGEKVDTLNGNPWDRIVKIYLRYRDDSSVPEEGTDGNVCIPRDRLNTFGRLRSNPFAATTGDLSKVHQRRESTANPLQKTFRNAWKLGTQLSEDEPPLLFDNPDDIFQRHENFDAGHLGNGVAVSLSDRSPIESGYGTLRSMMYSNLGTLGRKSEAGEQEEEEKFQFYPENVSRKTDEEMSLSSFSTFRTVSDGAITLKRNKSSLNNEQLEIAETFFFTVENNENDAFEFPPPPPPIVSLSRESSPLPPPPPVKQKPHGRNSISSVATLPPPPSPLSLRNSSIVAGFGSGESFPPPPSPLGLLSPREASPCGWPAPPSPLNCPAFDDDMLPLPSPPPALGSLQPSDTYFPPPPESLQIFSDIPPPPPPPPLKS